VEDGIPPSLRWSIVSFVDLGGIPTSIHGYRHVGFFIGTILLFFFGENFLGMKLGLHGLNDGLVLGLHTHMKEYNIIV
jgi:hypothetical protein